MSTYDDASLIYYPSGYKAGTAYSLKPTDGSGDLTFTRASTATRVNESGLIESVAANVPRIDYTGGGCGKLLLEPQRTNLVLASEQMNNTTYWANGSSGGTAVVTGNYGISPDGTQNAERIQLDAGSGYGDITQLVSITTGTTYTYSVYLKSLSGTPTIGVLFNGAENLTQELTTDWVRYSFTFTGAGGFCIPRFLVLPSLPGSSSTADILVWGAQLEAGSFPTSIIHTTTTAVTRVKDFGTTDVFGSTFTLSGDFVLFSDIKLKEIAANVLWSGGDYSIGADYRSYCIFSSTTLFRLFGVGEVVVADLSAVTFVAAHYKIAIRRESGVVNFFVNGTKYSSSGGTPSTTIKIRTISGANLGGKNSYDLNSAFINENTMSDAELLALTTI